jgi:hypothetical protein
VPVRLIPPRRAVRLRPFAAIPAALFVPFFALFIGYLATEDKAWLLAALLVVALAVATSATSLARREGTRG